MKALFQKLKRQKPPISAVMLFHENEVTTNRLSAGAMLVFGIAAFLLALIASTSHYNLGAGWCSSLVVADAFLFVLTWLIAKGCGYDRPWLKDLLLISSMLFSGVIYFLYPMNSAFLLFGPVLLSTRYYDGKLTARTVVMTWIIYVVIMQLAVYLNTRVEAIAQLREFLDIAIFNYPKELWKYHIGPRTFVLAVTGTLSVLMAENGRNLIIRQADISQKAATLETQMNLAAEIQTRALPAASFKVPGGQYVFSCSMQPAREVGGDFYDYFMIGENRLAFLVGDVSDKGLPAAMFMMAAQNALRLSLDSCSSVREAFQKANEQLTRISRNGMFVTVWGGVIDLESGAGEFVSAGHVPPILKRADGKATWIVNEPDLFLGAFEDVEYTAHEFRLEQGDCLVLYTDGVTDAKNAVGQRYGNERLIRKAGQLEPVAAALQAGIADDVEAFYRKMPQFDDITLLVCERKKT